MRYEGDDGFAIYIPSEHILLCGICYESCALASEAWADVLYCPHCGAHFNCSKRFDSFGQYRRWSHKKVAKAQLKAKGNDGGDENDN